MLMQYRHRLPAGYDLAGIRARVAERGPLWDATPGLAFKAFVLESREAGGAEDAYASVYLWRDPQAAAAFLTDARFAAVVAGFGRPEVETWMPLDVRTGPADRAGFLARTEAPIAVGTDLGALARAEAERGRRIAEAPGIFATIVGLDPKTWRTVRFTLRTEPADAADCRTILHLAQPAVPPAGRP